MDFRRLILEIGWVEQIQLGDKLVERRASLTVNYCSDISHRIGKPQGELHTRVHEPQEGNHIQAPDHRSYTQLSRLIVA